MTKYTARWECICGASGEVAIEAEDSMLYNKTPTQRAVDEAEDHQREKGCSGRGIKIYEESEK